MVETRAMLLARAYKLKAILCLWMDLMEMENAEKGRGISINIIVCYTAGIRESCLVNKLK